MVNREACGTAYGLSLQTESQVPVSFRVFADVATGAANNSKALPMNDSGGIHVRVMTVMRDAWKIGARPGATS